MARKNEPPFTPEELDEAYALAGDMWREAARAKVAQRFGETKTEAMRARIAEMRAAFSTFRPRHRTGSSVMHDAKTVSKDFRAAFPDAPVRLVENLKRAYMQDNR